MSAELLPCPFCAGDAVQDRVDGRPLFWVECRGECGVSGKICDSSDEAIAAWNTRPSQPLVEVQEPVAAWLSESLGDAVSAKKKSDMEQHNGVPGKKIAALYETPLYRAAPVRGLPLTEERLREIWHAPGPALTFHDLHCRFARAIEAAHGIKEST